ncbi:hypothetical protein ACFL5D_04390 [Candidatus Neomarinimicrobiota bacterium]
MKKYLFFILSITLFSCQKSQNKPVEVQNNTPINIPENVKQVSIVIDVDRLIGLNINEIKNNIGNPTSEFIPTSDQKRLMPDITSTAEWFSNEIGLSIDYRSNEKIRYIFVMNDGIKYSANELIKMANLNSNSLRYSFKPQMALNGSGITGIHVYGK